MSHQGEQIKFVAAPYPDATIDGLNAYDVAVDGQVVGQVWQVRTVSYGRVEKWTTGWKERRHVDWARTGSDELESTRRDAARSLTRERPPSIAREGLSR